MKTSIMIQVLLVTSIILVGGLPGMAQDQMIDWYSPDQYLVSTLTLHSDSETDGGVPYSLRPCPVVVTVSPEPQEICSVDDPVILAEFDQDMDPTTINDSSFVVHGQMSGAQVGTITYDAPSRTATFSGAVLETGELVEVVMTTEIASVEGASLCNPYVWTFNAASEEDGVIFGECVWLSVGLNPRGIAAADFNGDGAPDVVTANNGDNTVSVLMNNGGPYETDILEPRIDYAAGDSPWGVCVADFDRDGNPDVAIANNGAATISILMNSGGPYETDILEPRVDYAVASGPKGISASDIDGDGYLDLVTGGSGSNVSVLINDGSGVFGTHTEYATPSDHYAVYAADVNGDFAVDIVAPNYSSNNMSVFTNLGDGTFGEDSVYATGSHPVSVVVTDITSDGAADIAGGDWMGNSVSMFANNGDGTFAPRTVNDVGPGPHGICAYDLEGDGDMDLATANYHADSVSILQNDGEGNFNPYWNVGVGDGPVAITAADFNGDGYIDMATVNYSDNTVSLLLIAHEGCCGEYTDGITGNANCSTDGKMTLSDITRMIDHVYISKDPLCCYANGNTNGSSDCKITLSDVTRLIDAVYITKADPVNCMPECEE